MELEQKRTGFEIAVIGMSGRFPGARDIHEFWNNLKNGVESISFLSDEDVKKYGINPDVLKNPNYVRAGGGVLEDREYFDASFFGYTPRQAEIMDPQLRIFQESSWSALEDAGYNAESYEGLIGIYAGASLNFHWNALITLTGKSSDLGQFSTSQLINKDYLAARISYSLNLKGPAVVVQSACSTSLVAIHLACRALLTAECDIALAGGISLMAPQQRIGYIYQEGMINSPDGHCRAFDAKAMGTIGGEGVGVVVLKRLKHAAADGDNIYAIVVGSAINNDGKRKVGFSAPSIEAQAAVIKRALHMAQIEPESITYIESHGTGTPLGDPIEIEALKEAFNTNKKRFCGIGSIKSNIGHLDTAAGVASFIKTVLSLKHRLIPPGINFETPNPEIDFENSPFYVNTRLREWKNDEFPLRAGVSSFGIGGTNAHAILEEAPVKEEAGEIRPLKLIPLSARTKTALEGMSGNLLKFLKEKSKINLADAAYTLQIGRSEFQHRRFFLCSDIHDAVETLETLSLQGTRKIHTSFVKEGDRPITFMFPGLGAQYENMGLGLYETEPLFRSELDRCFEIINSISGCNIKDILFPANDLIDKAKVKINQIDNAQLVIFIFEYSLARLLINWGIKPDALIGYSFGEYIAACISGVFSLKDALNLLILRGKLIKETAPGAMLSVPLPKVDLEPLLNDGLSIAIDNGASCIVAGSKGRIDAFENRMKERRLMCIRLQASHAIHSNLMKPILNKFEAGIRQISLRNPQIPYISNVTGTWITDREAQDPHYWAKHMLETVRFADGIKELLSESGSIFVEIGPGNDLKTLANHHLTNDSDHLVINTVKLAAEIIPDERYLLNKVGRLWLAGVKIDWQAFHRGGKRCRIPLPTYPFEGLPYWIEGDPFKEGIDGLTGKNMGKKSDITDWFYIPSWKYSPLVVTYNNKISKKSGWLILMEETRLGTQLVKRLKDVGQDFTVVRAGERFAKVSDQEYTINPGENNDYNTLLSELSRIKKVPNKIIHLWGVTVCEGESSDEALKLKYVDNVQASGFYSLIYLAQAIGKFNYKDQIQIAVITSNMQRVRGDEVISPGKATILGAIKVIPQEYYNISSCSIDITLSKEEDQHYENLVDQLLIEFSKDFSDAVIAYRNNSRWLQITEPVKLEKSREIPLRLKKGGVYLITGGLGGIGYTIAEHLAKSVQAKLVLTGRSVLPSREDWKQWTAADYIDDRIARKIKRILSLEELNSEVLVSSADVCNHQEMQEVIRMAEKRFGHINGVIHSAGVPDGGVIPLRTREATDKVLAPKVTGTLILDDVLKNTELDFFIICSSLASITGGLGQVGYSAANAFQDAYAHYMFTRNGNLVVSINWDTWGEVGFGLESVKQLVENGDITYSEAESLLGHAILSSEGIDILDRIMEYSFPQVIISTRDLEYVNTNVNQNTGAHQEDRELPIPGQESEMKPQLHPGKLYRRPELSTEYAPPNTEFEITCANILQQYFGFEKMGIHDNLFEFGVTSLEMIHINDRLKRELKKDIPLVIMFEFPTIRSLEQYLNQEEKGESLDEYDQPDRAEEIMLETISILNVDD
ncbi:MAG: KR domain-containing protein [Candidatus Aminicenantes bacterium]|nr:KR domain-containing protein [Candidatus Aminicenantes bacterium]NIM82454.1 KR domain-containing protein [Candidatus Aminicenantes bacterium]NIN21815.1 KR domain-containing protein [Candidatus Aminicenantes bacterium]NIN45607.1 KR domain-containing protein [Candidatus Aminicenantes bacterium]NIN88438.1 KR domain-containing protein [Candidatus Aminicenantes bacterium]